MARLVEDLARGRQPRVGVVEALGELGGDDPGGELAPHQHRDRVRQRERASRARAGCRRALHRVAEDGRAVPDVARRLGVDAAQAGRLLLGQRERLVEQQRIVGPVAERPRRAPTALRTRARHDLRHDRDGLGFADGIGPPFVGAREGRRPSISDQCKARAMPTIARSAPAFTKDSRSAAAALRRCSSEPFEVGPPADARHVTLDPGGALEHVGLGCATRRRRGLGSTAASNADSLRLSLAAGLPK